MNENEAGSLASQCALGMLTVMVSCPVDCVHVEAPPSNTLPVVAMDSAAPIAAASASTVCEPVRPLIVTVDPW